VGAAEDDDSTGDKDGGVTRVEEGPATKGEDEDDGPA
jgi:hypothetical protein